MNDPWEEQGARALKGLEPIRFLVGHWTGRGQSYDEPVNGTFTVRALLDGTWLEADETLTNAAGEVVHHDLSLYRYNLEADSLEVMQLFEHAHRSIAPVELTADGFRWITGPGAPQLRYVCTADTLRYTVVLPSEAETAISMTYTRS